MTARLKCGGAEGDQARPTALCSYSMQIVSHKHSDTSTYSFRVLCRTPGWWPPRRLPDSFWVDRGGARVTACIANAIQEVQMKTYSSMLHVRMDTKRGRRWDGG